MSEDEPPAPIPEELFSEYEERPFAHCTRCGESLHDDQAGFQISKAYKRGECVMEYALCDHCRTAMMEEFSQESKKRLGQFQDNNVRLDRGLSSCSVCGVSRGDGSVDDFVITGLCEGSQLMHSIMVCGQCGDDIQDIISTKTRDTWRRFVDENFPGPPSEGEYPETESLPAKPLTALGGWKV
jgi:ribosomal protein L34E